MDENKQNGSLAFWAYLAAFLGVFGHATSEFFSVYSGLKGPEVSVWRFTIGGAALLVVALFQKESRNLLQPILEKPLKVIPLAVFGMSMAQLVFHWSLDFASVVQVATIVTTMPILVVVVERIINKTTISAPKVVSGIGAFIGVMLLLTDGYLDQLELGGSSLIGMALALCCAAVGALYLVLVRPMIQEYGAVRMTALTFIIGAFALWITVHLVWEISVNPLTFFERPPKAYWSMLALGIWNTCIGFILWLWGISNAPDISRANYLFFLKPVIAALLAWIILNNTISGLQILAILMVTGFVTLEMSYNTLIGKWKGLRKKNN